MLKYTSHSMALKSLTCRCVTNSFFNLLLQETSNERGESSKRGPCCHGSIRRWTHGCYTLVHDTDPEGEECALDVMLYVGGKGDVQTENKILIELLYLISLTSLLTHKDIRTQS